MKTDVYVLDNNFNVLDTIDYFESLIWTTRYNQMGEFEMYIVANDKTKELLKTDTMLVRKKDIIKNGNIETMQKIMIIKQRELMETTDNMYIITGFDLLNILQKRVVYPKVVLQGNINNCVENLLNACIINPDNINRKIDNFQFMSLIDNDEEIIDTQITGDNLYTYLKEFLKERNIGCRVDVINNVYTFILYSGKDRTYNQNDNLRVVFSKKFDNINKFDYIYDTSQFCNTCIVAGEGEDDNRKVVRINDEITGLNRNELFVDARDLSSKTENGATIPATQYENQLIQRGNEKLKEKEISVICDSDIEPNTSFKIYEDYDLGDIVEVDGLSETMTPQISEIIESENREGVKTVIGFEV